MGRQGNTDTMDLAKAGLEADSRGLLEVYTQHRIRGVRAQASGARVGFAAKTKTKRVSTLLIVFHVGRDIMATVPAVCLNRQTHFSRV